MDTKNIKLPEGETLIGIAEIPKVAGGCFLLIKRDHQITPWLIRGYDANRGEMYTQEDGRDFIPFVFQDGAYVFLQLLIQRLAPFL